MSKLLIFNFDGTSNEPSDAVQDVDYKGAKEDDNITNVLKFHLMLGGDLLLKKKGADYESNWDDTDQVSLMVLVLNQVPLQVSWIPIPGL